MGNIAISPRQAHQKMRVSRYDYLSGGLVACITVFGIVFMILIACLLQAPLKSGFVPPDFVSLPPVVPLEKSDSNDTVDAGAEVPEVQPPIDERVFEQVTEAVSTVRATSNLSKDGSGDVFGKGEGRGIGWGIDPVPGGDTPHLRWDVTYLLSDAETYSAQLRFYEVQLGLVHKTEDVVLRVADIGKTNKAKKSDRASEAQSSYFSSANRQMRKWDQGFAKAAIADSGEEASSYITVHFISDLMTKRFLASEKAALPAGKTVDDIEKTHFKIVPVTKIEFRIEVTRIDFK